MAGEWQVVQNSKPRATRPKPKAETAQENGNSQKDPAGSAFAKLDADFANQSLSGKTNGTSTSTGAFSSLPVEASPPPSPKGPNTPPGPAEVEPKKAAKPKKPKVKKATTSDIASRISVADLKMVLVDFEEKYGSDEHSQLERVADYFLGSFKDADIPFNKTVLEQPIKKAGNVPIADLPEEITDHMIRFYQKKDAQNVADFLLSLLKVFIADIPETGVSKTPRKAKVGLLMTIALMLRSRPEAVVVISQELLSNSSFFCTPGRLPFLLWAIQQAASADLSVAIAVWTRTFLPQVLGSPLPTAMAPAKGQEAASVASLATSSADLAVRFVEDTLQEAEQSTSRPPTVTKLGVNGEFADGKHSLNLTETSLLFRAAEGISIQVDDSLKKVPVVVPEALEGIARACYGDPPSIQSVSLRNRLLKVHVALKDLVLMGISKGQIRPADAIRLLLDTATIAIDEAPSSSPENAAVEHASGMMLEYIYADPKGVTSMWEQRHKHQIKGSAAILEYLAGYNIDVQTLAKNPARRHLLLATLRHLRDRHRGLLATGKGWQQKAARKAEQATTELTQKIVFKQRKNGAVNLLLGAMIAILTVLFLGRQGFIQDFVTNSRRELPAFDRVASSVESGLTGAQAQLQSLSDTTVGPAYQQARQWIASEYEKSLKPAVESLTISAQEQFNALLEKATEFLHQK